MLFGCVSGASESGIWSSLLSESTNFMVDMGLLVVKFHSELELHLEISIMEVMQRHCAVLENSANASSNC